MKASEFNRYAKEVTNVKIENICPKCKVPINAATDIDWLPRLQCMHRPCGTMFLFDPEREVYIPIGEPAHESRGYYTDNFLK